MAVLAEAISVVIKLDKLLEAFEGNWPAFAATVPNATLCADTQLARVGFMRPEAAKDFVLSLEQRGLTYLNDGKAQDIVVVDQIRGPMSACGWIEFGQVNLDGNPSTRVAMCRLAGSTLTNIACPNDWTFAESLSATFGFVPTAQKDRSLRFLRRDNGLDVYFNPLTGQEVFVAAQKSGPSQ